MCALRKILFAGLLATPAVWASAQECRPGDLRILTGSESGYYHKFGKAVQEVAKRDGLKVCALATDRTVENISQLRAGQADFALVQSDVAHDAWFRHGSSSTADFNNIRLVMPLYVEAVHVLVRPHLNVSSLSDLRGRKVWLGRSNSATEFTAKRILTAAGLVVGDGTTSSIEAVTLSDPCDAVRRLRIMDGSLDAVFRVTLVPASDIQDALERALEPQDQDNGCVGSSEIGLLSLDYELVERLVQDGSYVEDLIPGPTYGLKKSTLTVGVQALLLTNRRDGDPVVQTLAHLLREKRSAIQSKMAEYKTKKHSHKHAEPKLALLNVPTPEPLVRFVHPLAEDELYQPWRDSWMPLLPFVTFLSVVVVLLLIRVRVVLRHALLRQPRFAFAAASTTAIWLIGSGVLYHMEGSVNECFNSFPRSLVSTFLYFTSLPGGTLVTQAGRSAGEVTRWLSLVLLGGFAVPLLKQGMDTLGKYFWQWLEEDKAVLGQTSVPEPARVPEVSRTPAEAA